jgi:hypothetical protein
MKIPQCQLKHRQNFTSLSPLLVFCLPGRESILRVLADGARGGGGGDDDCGNFSKGDITSMVWGCGLL